RVRARPPQVAPLDLNRLLTVAALAAAAHGGEYRSVPRAIEPPVRGVLVRVEGGDERLRLDDRAGVTLVVEGYEGEPYLRFDRRAAGRTRRSPATYLNTDRHARVALPEVAAPRRRPDWELVEPGGRAYSWFDHRIHWMREAPPAAVEAHPERAQKVFDWAVPLVVGGAAHRPARA